MPRPTDWSALGLGGDPTPGDPDRIDSVITSQDSLVTLADTIDEGLTSIKNTTDGVFVGKTADALRKVIDEDLRNYVSTFRQAHKDAQGALRTYVGVMREQQRRADEALTAAAALAEDDEAGREEQKSIAEDAASRLESAAGTAASVLREAAYSIASPIDECEEFWKALGWLALILVIPAMIVGGPLALFTIALNVALLIKTAVDFSQGKASITDLVLSIIGVIAPSTKGMRLGDLWKGLKGLGSGAFNGARNLFMGGPNAFGLFGRLTLGIDDVFQASNAWLRGLNGINGLKFTAGVRFMPGPKGFTLGGHAFSGGVRFVPAAVDLTVINLMGAKTFFGLRSLLGAVNGIRGIGASLGSSLVNGVRGLNGLRLFLPVAADELGHGLVFALKIGVIDRGVFGMYRYGAFAGGQFLGAGSKISGGVASGLSLMHPVGDLGSLPHINAAQFAPSGGGSFGTGLHGLPSLSVSDSVGRINLSGFQGLGSSFHTPVPGIGAKLVDVPATGSLGVAGVHLPTLGPVSSVSAPGMNGVHVPSAGAGVGTVGVQHIGLPHLGTSGVGRLDQTAVGGLGAVHTPSLGQLGVPTPGQAHVPTPGQVNAPAVGQVNVPSLGSVTHGPTVARMDAPAVGARVSDLPAVNGAGRVDVPSVSQVGLPSIARSVDVAAPSVARVEVPAIGRSVDVSTPSIAQVDVALPGRAGHPDVATPSGAEPGAVDVGQVAVPSVPAPHAETPAVRTGHLAAPAQTVPVDGVRTPPVGQVAPGPHATAVPPAAVEVSRVSPTPTPSPATSGGLGHPGNGAVFVDLPKLGRVDLSALAQRTVEVRMVRGIQLNLQHTFSDIDVSLPGVRVDVQPGTGTERAHVTLTNPAEVQGLSARHIEANGQDVLQIEHVLPDGTTHRWSYALQAPDYGRIGDMQIIPAGAQTAHIELMPVVGSSHTSAPAGAVPVPAAPAPRVLDVPGLHGARIELRFDGPSGAVSGVRAVTDGVHGLPPLTVQHVPRPGGTDLVHVERQVGAVEVRSIDLVQDADGLRPVSDERLITLAGGDFRGTTVAIDVLNADTARHVPRANTPAPVGQVGWDGSELLLPTGRGFQLFDPGNGLPTRTGTRLADGAGGNVHVVPSRDGHTLHFTDAHNNPTPPPPNAHTTPQTNGSFRLHYNNHHIILSPNGTHTHNATPLHGTDEYALQDTHTNTPTRVDTHGTNRGPITLHNTEFHIPTDRGFQLYDTGNGHPTRTGTHLTDATGGNVHVVPSRDGHTLHFTDAHNNPTPPPPNAHTTPQTNGSFRLHYNNHHIILSPNGTHTHNATPLHGTDEYALQDTHTNTPTRVDTHGTNRGPITLHNTEFHIPTGIANRTRFHALNGDHTHDLLTLQGGPHAGQQVRIAPDGTAALPGATVHAQPGGAWRIQQDNRGIVVAPDGTFTHDVVALAGTPHFAHLPHGGGPAALRAGDGANVPHGSVTSRPDGRLVVVDGATTRLHTPDGRTEFTATRLSTGESIRVRPGGARELLDTHLTRVDGTTVTVRPHGGHHLTGADGTVRLFDGAGTHTHTRTPPADGGHVIRVDDGHGAHAFDAVQLSDGVGARFVRTDTHTLLDGDLNAVPDTPHGTFSRTPDGGYRIDHPGPGPHHGEYKVYDADGRLTGQRINVIDRGTVKPNEYLRLDHAADGAAGPSWVRVRLDATGVPVRAPSTQRWYDAGTIDGKGLGTGRVGLTSHSGVPVMERRTLPGGHTVDAYHSRAGVGTFGRFNQRGVWTEFAADGTVVRAGTRHWGESGRSWFDVTGSGSGSPRVRHFQENPDGGHVLAELDNRPFTQGFAGPTRWTRFDGEFKQVAEGTRSWGPGRGFTDSMPHPVTGERVVMQEKWGRFQWSPHDVRRYQQTELGADGVPQKDYTSWSAHGKENGRGLTLENGDFLESRRFAEQRPPVAFRWTMSGDYRAANLHDVPWLRSDSKLQVHHWSQTAADGTGTHGVRFVSMNGTVTDVTRGGEVVRETRKLLGGDTVKTGDVQLPDGVARQDGYLPFSQGEGKPHGHRTYHQPDFDPLPARLGDNLPPVRWQEKVTTDLHDADWYSPDAAKEWRVVRVGLADGTVIDFRPTPGGPNRIGHLGDGDWTRYDHHGLVVARQDTWPAPGGGPPVEVTSTGMLDGNVRWTDNLGNNGVRKVNFDRGDVTRWGWDRESFQDFDATGALVRDHRLLADGTVVDAWRGPAPNSGWHWNKAGADGAVKNFGTGTADRVRQWFDGHGNRLADWQAGARFEDSVTSLDHRVVQEIPARPAGTPHLADSPHRIREYVPSPGDAFKAHAWKEYENGIELGRKVELPDGTFLESEDWHKQWRRFGKDGVTLIEERTVSGYVWQTDFLGRHTLIGRETNFTGVFNEYRGFSRMWREPNRWEWGHTHNGVSTYTPFVNKAAQAVVVDMLQEWLLDFGMNLAVYGIVAAATGTPFGWSDVGKAAFGASVAAGVKGGFAAGHFATHRGGPWKTGLSQIDMGTPYPRRPNDDTWAGEFGGNEKVTRWRSGTYDFGMGLVSGSVSGFISGAATAAIFGVKDKDGNTVHLQGGDALLAGLYGMAGGVAGAVSLGMARTAITQSLAGRWYHRQGFFDIFAVAGLGKLIDKIFANMYLAGALRESINPGWYQGSGENNQNGEPQ
ncbi:hypothetical protein ACIREM_34010 [Streptomyces shenzhenensis]|uniref:hypothetical protein n=1 Tax=Streptomyces shenzhenensis TaxID=943815 RepID=UPI0037FA7118